MAQTAMTLSKMEGKELPAYHFTDLNGRLYDKNSTKGKILVIKCWFIHCGACVKEFPALNTLVDRYKDRNDIQFVSLASDAKPNLVSFFAKKPFKYATVPDMDSYMTKQLAVNAYPMHLLINREGEIVKVTNAIDDLIPSLEEIAQTSH